VTTPSGKPPFDEQALDTSWEAGSDAPTGGPDRAASNGASVAHSSSGKSSAGKASAAGAPSAPAGASSSASSENASSSDDASRDPVTPRPPPAGNGADAAGEANDPDATPIYGTGVPYGGDDHTEEIDPIALEAPFAADERKDQRKAAAAAVTPRAPVAAPHRGLDLKGPAAQLMLSDLFDSVPSSSSLAPPDPAAFTSGRPAPLERPPSEPPPARDAIVGLPNIDIGSAKSSPKAVARPEPAAQRAEPEPAHRSSPRAAIPTPQPNAPTASPSAASSPAASPSAASSPTASPSAASPLPPPVAVSPVGVSPVGVAPQPSSPVAAEEPEAKRRSAPMFESVTRAPDPDGVKPTIRLSVDPEMSTATQRISIERGGPVDPEMFTATQRLNIDPALTRDASLARDPEMSTATIRLTRDMVPTLPATGSSPSPSSPSPSSPSNAPARAPMPSSPGLSSEPRARMPSNPGLSSEPRARMPSNPGLSSEPRARMPSNPGLNPASASASEPGPDVAHFPSDVATTRPPDVMLSPAPAAGPSPAAGSPAGSAPQRALRPLREPMAPMTAVTAPASSQFKDASQLPSIMLGADVEAEPDNAAKRALRAARATVRLELPPGFGRPGSPLGNSPSAAPAAPAASSSSFVPSAPPLSRVREPWHENPRTRRLLGAALAGLLLFVTLMFALSPRSGSLVVTALAPGNRAVDDVTIFIDGKPLCDVSPCRIKGLTPGMHTLRASAPNLASQAEETVEISAGDESTYNIDLLAVAPEVRSGVMRVPAGEAPLTLYVDGKRVGRLPQEVSGLSAGKHWVKLDPEDGSATIEKSVNVLAGEVVEVEPKPAKREKALVTIRLGRGSEGAQVTFDDAFLLDFPAELELEPSTVHTLSATKPGYEDLALDVEIAEGETEKLIEVSLQPLEGGARKARPAKVARKPATKPAPTTASTALADSTQGLLNISSTPPSQIILNGRPLGSTPKTGITVPGDSLQTIVFVHPKMGRRRAQKFVPAGKERTVSIRF